MLWCAESTRSVIRVGRISVDLTARKVTEDGKEIRLTALEFGILEALALRVGQLVSRAEISVHVYGFDAEPDSNAIDVHIAQIRRKLEGGGRPKLIHTRRGLGYQLAENP